MDILQAMFDADIWNVILTHVIDLCKQKILDDSLFFDVLRANSIIIKRAGTNVLELTDKDHATHNDFVRTMVSHYYNDPRKGQKIAAMLFFYSNANNSSLVEKLFDSDGYLIEKALAIGKTELQIYRNEIKNNVFNVSDAVDAMNEELWLSIWRFIMNIVGGTNRMTAYAIDYGALDWILIMKNYRESFIRADAWKCVSNITISGVDMINTVLTNAALMNSVLTVLRNDVFKVKSKAASVILNILNKGEATQVAILSSMNAIGNIATYVGAFNPDCATEELIYNLLTSVDKILEVIIYTGKEKYILYELDESDIVEKIERLMMEMGCKLNINMWYKSEDIQNKIDSMRSVDDCYEKIVGNAVRKEEQNFKFGVQYPNKNKFDF